MFGITASEDNKPQGTWETKALKMVHLFSTHVPHQYRQRHAIIAWTIEEHRENITSTELLITKRFTSILFWHATLKKKIFEKNIIVFANGMRPKIWYLRSGSRKNRRKWTSAPSSWQKLRKDGGMWHKLAATLCWNSEALITGLPNRRNLPELDIGQFYITKNGSSQKCTEYSEPWKSQDTRLRAMFIDHVKIWPVTGIEVIEWLWKCRYRGTCEVSGTNLKPQARCKAVPKPKSLYRLDLVNENGCLSGQRERTTWIMKSETFPSTSCVFCDTEAVMKLTEQYHGQTFCRSWKILGILQIGTRKIGLKRAKPTTRYIRALQGYSPAVATNPNFLCNRYRSIGRNICL